MLNLTLHLRRLNFSHIPHLACLLLLVLTCLFSAPAHARAKMDAQSTAECEEQVLNWKASQPMMPEKVFRVEMDDCKNIDGSRQNHRISLAIARLKTIMSLMNKRLSISQQQQREIYADQIELSRYADQPILNYYQKQYQEFIQKALVHGGAISALAQQRDSYMQSCRSFYQTHQKLRQEHQRSLLSLLNAKSDSRTNAEADVLQLEIARRTAKDRLRQHTTQAERLQCLFPAPAVAPPLDDQDELATDELQTIPDFSPPGNLRKLGNYLWRNEGSVATPLANGMVFIYGAGLKQDYWQDYAYQYQLVQAHLREGRYDTLNHQPLLWDPHKRGWIKLAAAPECPKHGRSLHTTTVLQDGRILITGGLCQKPDKILAQASKQFSLFDTQTRQWLQAPVSDQARIYHSANLLADGSVIIIGGIDAEQIASANHLVLNSVEIFQQAGLKKLPPLNQARARHSSLVLSDGSVIVSGGIDQQGHALASVELWRPGATSWRKLKDMQYARYNHAMSRLKDGRVIVTGGWGEQQTLSSVELLDMKSEQWSEGPELPLKLHGHSMLVQPGGEVIVVGGAWLDPVSRELPWAWSWDQSSMDWRAIAISQASNREALSGNFSLLSMPNGAVKIFAQHGIFIWQPIAPQSSTTAPRWREDPKICLLKSGQAVWIGNEFGDVSAKRAISYIYDPKTISWRLLGRLQRANQSNSSSIELADQSIMHVSIDSDVLYCEVWHPQRKSWQDCGFTQTDYVSSARLELGLLQDGRVFAITNLHEAFVYEANSNTWQRWHIKWDSKSLEFGVAVPLKRAFFSLYDEDNGNWLSQDRAGANFWMRGRSSDGERLLLSSDEKTWTYALRAHNAIGRDAQFLPDGCVLSSLPLALFNPRKAKAELLAGPLAAKIPAHGTLQVYPDGSFTMAKASLNDSGHALDFIAGKASCAGVQISEQEDNIFGELIVESQPAPKSVLPANEKLTPKKYYHEKILPVFQRYFWVIIILATLLTGIVLVKKLRLNQPRLNTSTGFRILVYAAVILFGMSMLSRLWRAQQVDIEVSCDLDIRACIDEKTGLLNAKDNERSSIPCHLLGLWTYRRHGLQMRIQLKEDGTYQMETIEGGKVYQGLWAKQGKAIAWRHQQSGTGIELNPLEILDAQHFQLKEGDGSLTTFDLVQANPSSRCSKD